MSGGKNVRLPVAALVAHQVDVHQGSHRLEKYFITDRGLCLKSS